MFSFIAIFIRTNPKLARLLLELLAAGVIVGALLLWHHRAFDRGIQAQRDQDQMELDRLKWDAEQESKRLQKIAATAERNSDEEHQALVDYTAAHPLHGSLCPSPHARSGDLSRATQGPSLEPATAPDVFTVSAGAIATVRQPDPDVRGMLDVLGRRADEISAELRKCETVDCSP